MSKWIELAKLLPKAIANIDEVAQGWINSVKLENGELAEHEVEEIVRRRLICQACPFNSANAVKEGWYVTERTDEHCIHCGCPLKAKTACLKCNCGIENFNAAHPDRSMELKWHKYEK